ncbi:ATP-binding protein, partial [Streptomyces sp. NPDC006356]
LQVLLGAGHFGQQPLGRALPLQHPARAVAETFNQVQTMAAALLERQVLSRRNVAEMFGNVGRRVSNLTTRQLSLIDAVERGETDPALLERLYSIDHIAVRLRRNADSLMLLAGIHEAVLDSGPSPLTTVVRAALGQIEGYRRVELRARTEAVVEPEVIGDLTLMVAELLENAVSFSPEDSPVEVSVATAGDDAVIVVTDHGLGMTPERLDEENARLIRRERLDLVPTKVLGLFVVGTLARRWEITVTLSRTPGGGVTAEVTVPSSLLVTGSTTGSAATAALAKVAAATPPAVTPSAAKTPSAPAAGPRPSATVPADAVRPDGDAPRPLPRRVSHREAAPPVDHARADQPEPVVAATRPLRRRVRGATLRTTAEPYERQAALPQEPRTLDADAVRASLDEFEAAVERAHRDSRSGDTGEHSVPVTTTTPHEQDQNDSPEGAEQ